LLTFAFNFCPLPNLPHALIESLKDVNGFDETSFKEVHQSNHQITSIRINPAKPSSLKGLQIEGNVPWCYAGRYLSIRPSFTLDPAFHGGAYYVQEASSMFIDYIVRQLYVEDSQPKHVLDLCAAPGGKSTLLAAALPGSFIVSNEVIKTRVTVLAENISKWGSSNVVVTNNDPKDFQRLPGYFNLMVVDAPCSGSGLFRKDADAIEEWSEANVQLCSMRQQRILADAIGSLQENGYLIYSTCSYSKEEDEDICDWIVGELKLTPVNIPINSSWGVVETLSSKHKVSGYRFYPDKVKGEGLFVACFKQANPVDEYYPYSNPLPLATRQERSIVDSSINSPDDYNFYKQKDLIVAFPKKWQEEFPGVSKALNVRKSGVAIGEIKGKDLIPHHELALSTVISNDVPHVELDKEQALKYLKRQDLSIDATLKGWALGRYGNINLGWMKVLPNRVNNYYPTNWRILKP
jgi:16S rRNA C967 or C1407 C5-methylase (RsmB/RsmF family)/NOL1/NOP2/fmu family ribosome biogenesis protein